MKDFNPENANVKEIFQQLEHLADPKYLNGMQRYGILFTKALGISLPQVRLCAKQLKKNSNKHTIALQLWQTHIHEAQILATLLADPKEFTPQEMDTWVNDLGSWDTCDQACSNLFRKTDYFLEKAYEYSYSEKEFVKRCGFVLMTQYAVHNKKSSNDPIQTFLIRIEDEAYDERNFVKKALNWLLRQIGKRNPELVPAAVECATRLLQQPYSSAKWIANDALREFKQKGLI